MGLGGVGPRAAGMPVSLSPAGKRPCQPSRETSPSSRKDASGPGRHLGWPVPWETLVLGHTPVHLAACFSDLLIHSFAHSFSGYIQQPLRGRLPGVRHGAGRRENPPEGARGQGELYSRPGQGQRPDTQPHSPKPRLELRQRDTCPPRKNTGTGRGLPGDSAPRSAPDSKA